jgi:predicted metal-dependent phosphoesterase TrpH
MIDLHIHSTFSDGSLTPTQIVALARDAGVSTISVTDHDSTDGVPELLEACGREGVEGIAGVEISAEVPRGTMHVLGYGVDLYCATLLDALRQIRASRCDRNKLILDRLNSLGYALRWEEVSALAGEDVVGRPHFAQALVNRRYVKTREDAFDRLLAKGKPGYVDRFRFTPEDSIGVIRAAGGIAVMAHPFTLELGPRALADEVRRLAALGLGGIEVYYSEHPPELQEQYRAMAESLGLLATGGSDFHGDGNPAVRVGRGFGNLNVPDALMGPLRQAIGAAATLAMEGKA